MLNKDVTVDTGLSILRSGVWYPAKDESLCYVWVVLDRAECERLAGGDLASEAGAAEGVTGWYETYSGPGRWFSNAPSLKVYGHKVLVRQRRGQDV